jgi:hypothetical protein
MRLRKPDNFSCLDALTMSAAGARFDAGYEGKALSCMHIEAIDSHQGVIAVM